MFLSNIKEDRHELDFRFEHIRENSLFIFVHHGLNLADMADRINLGKFGTYFYIVEMEHPFTLEDIVADKGLFEKEFGIEPNIAFEKFIKFDNKTLNDFFLKTKDNTYLDFGVVGGYEKDLAEDELKSIKANLDNKYLARKRQSSFLHVHDNHFVYIEFSDDDIHLVKKLISESIIGFFYQLQHNEYVPLPDSLIDLMVKEYHTTSLTCYPDTWDDEKLVNVQSDKIKITKGLVEITITTAESWWTAYKLNPPKQLPGRNLTISYDTGNKLWDFR